MSTPRTIVVTGATGGIGSEIVDRFHREGDQVVATGLSAERLADWRRRWDDGEDAAPRLSTIVVDVTSDDSVTELAAHVAELGGVDVVINNAGSFPHDTIEDMTIDAWQRVIDIDLTGTFRVIKALLPLISRDGRGRIINIGSGTLYDGTPGLAHYAAAKGGVLGLTRVLSRELGSDGITVNVMTPGLTRTAAAVEAMPEGIWEEQRAARGIPRDETAEDAVGGIFFLASDAAAFMTGQVLNIDGGSKFP